RSTRTCRRESGCVTSHEPQSVAPGTLVPRGHPYQASQGWVGHHLSTARSGWGELDAIALIERGSFWCSCMKNAILESSWVRLRVGQGRLYNGTMMRALVYSHGPWLSKPGLAEHRKGTASLRHDQTKRARYVRGECIGTFECA